MSLLSSNKSKYIDEEELIIKKNKVDIEFLKNELKSYFKNNSLTYYEISDNYIEYVYNLFLKGDETNISYLE